MNKNRSCQSSSGSISHRMVGSGRADVLVRILSLAICVCGSSLPAALRAEVIDASHFGFSSAAENNFAAMRALEEYANTHKSVSVRFPPGTFVVKSPVSGEPGYRGRGQAASWMKNVNGVVIDASQAWFKTPDSAPESALFRFSDSRNVRLHANFEGDNYGDKGNGRDSVTAIHLWSNNENFDLVFEAVQMFDGVRIGNWILDRTASVDYSGNKNITVNAKGRDTVYTVAAYLASKLTLAVEVHGTAARGYGARRAVYLAGCDDVRAVSESRDMNISDGVNLITTNATVHPPYHIGSTNVTLHAIDTGSTMHVNHRRLAKLGVVTNDESNISATHKNIAIQLSFTGPMTDWLGTHIFSFGALGTGAQHRFEDITLSGRLERMGSNLAVIFGEGNMEGLAYLGMNLVDFHDIGGPTWTPLSIRITNPDPTVEIQSFRSTVGSVYFINPTRQSYTDHGDKPPPGLAASSFSPAR